MNPKTKQKLKELMRIAAIEFFHFFDRLIGHKKEHTFQVFVEEKYEGKKTYKITIGTLLIVVIPFFSVAQTNQPLLQWLDGSAVKKGDTVQILKPSIGKNYAYITYKYVGSPTGLLQRKGQLSDQYENQVVVVSQVDEGLIRLKGVRYYTLICDFENAVRRGEIRKYTE